MRRTAFAALVLLPSLLAAPAHADPAWRTLTPNWTWPNTGVSSVSASSPTNLWVAGYQGEQCLSGGDICPLEKKVALQRWDGIRWTSFVPPGMERTGAIDQVKAFAPDNVWVSRNGWSNGYVAHYDGTSWTRVPMPDPAVGRNPGNWSFDGTSVWATGTWDRPDPGGGSSVVTTVLRYDGTTWSRSYDGDHAGVRRLEMRSPDDGWAFGLNWTPGHSGWYSAAWHWDGAGWSEREFPASDYPLYGTVSDLDVVSGTEAYAAISAPFGAAPYWLLRYDGTTWKRDFTLSAPTSPLAVAGFARTADGTTWASLDGNLYLRDAQGWTKVESGGVGAGLTSIPGTNTLLDVGPGFSVRARG